MKCRLTCAWLLVSVIVGRAESSEGPFVAGFDRFFRATENVHDVGGQLLIGELNCTACHATKIERLRPRGGPRLDAAGHQFQADWLYRFLTDPHGVKPGTTMPDLWGPFSVEEKQRIVRAIVAFLSTRRAPYPELNSTASNPIAYDFWNKGDPVQGRQLYHQIGCVACHAPDREYRAAVMLDSELKEMVSQLEPGEIRELGLADVTRRVRSVPHGDLTAKYTRQSLTYFLLDPARTRPSGRMPSLKLSPAEAASIASYLLRDQADDVVPIGPSDDAKLIAQGRDHFTQLGCANCHAIDGVQPTRHATPLAQLDLSANVACLSRQSSVAASFPLSDEQRKAMREALARMNHWADSHEAPQQQLEFQMLRLNCYGCHTRHRRGGVGLQRQRYFQTAGHVDLGDEGRLPPPLDSVGRKLKPDWLRSVLEGRGDRRPFMLARMPKFPSRSVASISALLVQSDATKDPSDKPMPSDQNKLVDAGRALLDVGCVQCHPLRGEHLPGVIGVDLADIDKRLERKWFRDFLYNPASLKPRTRMPTFFPNGRSSVPLVLDGDVDRQIAAMWSYLREVRRQPLPTKILENRAHDFELIPTDRPIVLRTFMKEVGTHAIAVGFPQKVHFSFDAQRVRVAQAWRGRFLDAHGTWFDRFAPPAAPLGTGLISMPPGVPLAVLGDAQQSWPSDDRGESGYQFRGYRIDSAGVPTFLYRFQQLQVEDTVRPMVGRHLSRQLRIVNSNPPDEGITVWFRAHAARELSHTSPRQCASGQGLTVTVTGDAFAGGRLRSINGLSEWIVPLELRHEVVVEVNYQW